MVELLWYALTLKNQPPDVSEPKFLALYERQARRFTRNAEEMGGLLIKVGQFLSSRVDLLPKPYLTELAKLQDRVQAAPWESIKPIIEQEMGPLRSQFLWFSDTPLAAASLGQVYEAVLLDGDRVAVKVQRPGITRIVQADLQALGWVVRLATRVTEFGKTFNLTTVLREFRRLVFEELDYQHELANTEIIREYLKGQPHVIVPRTYENLSTERILVMDFFQGVKIDDVARLKEEGIAPEQVAERLIRLYLHMVMESGVYHADPHAGNILVDPKGDLILLDYGMVGSLDIATKRNIRRFFVAVSTRDPGTLLQAMAALGMLRPDADMTRLRRRVGYLLNRYYAETLDQLGHLDIPQLLRDFETVLRDQAIQVPGQFAFLGRAIAILVGLATALYPEINLVELFAPYAHRFVTEESGGTAAFLAHQAERYGRTWAELPLLSAKVLRRMEQGELETRVEWTQGSQGLHHLHSAVRGLTAGVYAAASLVSGVLLLPHHPWIARILFALAVIIIINRWWRGRRE